MNKIQALWVRGGTSKCWVIEADAMTRIGVSPDELLPRLFGSPDSRQLDGVGGGTSTTSKAIIVSRSQRNDVDIEFTFAQVGIDELNVDWGSNCGNCSTAAGLFALHHGWIPLRNDETLIRTFNTNTSQVILQTIPTPGAKLPQQPTATMPGCPYPGYEVRLGFLDPAGRTTGSLLPGRLPKQVLQVGSSEYVVSLVDAGAPVVLLSAVDLGLSDEDYPDWPSQLEPRLGHLDQIRRAGAVEMGMVHHDGHAERAVPKLGVVGPPSNGHADLNVLMLSMGKPHPAMPITGSIAITAAIATSGTLAHELSATSSRISSPTEFPFAKFRFRTPAGVLEASTSNFGNSEMISVGRTARIIAETSISVPMEAGASPALQMASGTEQ